MTGRSALIYGEELLKYDFGPFHPLKPERLSLTFELIKALDLLNTLGSQVRSPRVATVQEIFLFHTPEYVRQVQEASEKGIGRLDLGDTPVFKRCFDISSTVVGATLEAIDIVMKESFQHAFNPSGGLHHAHRGRASGFCIFNDAAVGIAYLKSEYGLKRIMYVDIDAHHGDGVMYGFYNDPTLLDVDFHEYGHYSFPGTGRVSETGEGPAEGLKVNIPFPPSTSDESFIYAFNRLVPTLAKMFRPEFIILQCGADAHKDDGLARLDLTTASYEQVTLAIHQIAHEICNGRLVALGGGGYNLSNTSRCWTIIYGILNETDYSEEIPKSWREYFESVTKEPSPSRLRDEVESYERNRQIADDVLGLVRQIETMAGSQGIFR